MERAKIRRAAFIKIFLSFIILTLIAGGCGQNSDVTGAGDSSSGSSNPSNEIKGIKVDSTSIWFDLKFRFKSENIKDSRFLDSHNGSQFNHIVYLNEGINPGEEIDLQELQPFGIYALYLRSEGMFTLTNSDGLAISTKSIFLERCSFIDLKLQNTSLKSIKVAGFVAGE